MTAPPRWAETLLRIALPPGIVRESVLGDLEEDFEVACARMSPGRARRRYARQALGLAVRYAVLRRGRGGHDASSSRWGRGTVQAAKHAARSLRHSPGFVALTTLTLAIGVGSTTAIFSVVDTVLLRPLPYPDAEELVALRYANGDREIDNHSEPEYWDVAREIAAFEDVAAYAMGNPVLGGTAEPERIAVVRGTASLLRLLEVAPLRGRIFADEEDAPGADPVVVISHGLWTRAFGADPAVVGTTVLLEDRPHTIVGVMPEGFTFPDPETQAWVPLALDREQPWGRNNHYLRVIARLDAGMDIGTAAAQLDQLGARDTEIFPDFYAERVSFRAYPLHERLVGDVRAVLLLLMGGVVGVLLIGAVNAASLFLARAERRRGEIAVRTALGAGRARISAQVFFESAFVSLLAGASGMALAWLGVRGLERFAPPDVPRLEQVALDGRVLSFGVALTLATGVLFGLAPAFAAWRPDVRAALAVGGRGGIGSRRGTRFRRALVVGQLAIATALVLGSGLLLRSFSELRRVELGFAPEGALVVPLSPANSSVAPDAEAVAFYERLEQRVAALPGVEAVGSALRVPLRDGHDNFSIRVEGAEAGNVGEAPAPGIQWATPGYFAALRIPLRAGRLYDAGDDGQAPLVVVVSESLASELWPGIDPIGRRIAMWVESMPWMEVVGVVADVKQTDVQAPASAMLYVPHAQAPASAYYAPNAMSLFVRTDGDPAALAPGVRGAIRDMDATIPIGRVQTMTDVSGAALARERFTLLLIALFSSVALTLSAVGVYGVVVQAVSARTREFGLRMAVGANSREVAASVLREGLTLALWGIALGLAIGVGLSAALAGAFYGVGPLDPWALAGTAPVLAAVAALAALMPALGAARLDPVEALRDG